MKPLPIVRPSFPHLEDFESEFNAALESGVLTNNGPWVQAFEKALTEYLGVPTIVFNNGQSALMAMLAASDIRGGNVICPSFTFCATPHAIEWAGGIPIFCDIDETTLCLSDKTVQSRIGSRTRAILGVDPYGITWNGFDSNLWVLGDSAPSFGSTRSAWLDANIFSFHATKPFSTMEGGALCSRNPNLLDRARRIRNFGQSDDGDCEFAGLNGKMLEVCALIGLRQLETWGNLSSRRMATADALEASLEGIPGLNVIKAPPGQHPIWLYRPILIQEEFGMSRDAVVAALKRLDINTRTYYRPAHLLSCYKHMNVSLPVTERIASQVISLPLYSDMTEQEIDRVASALRNLRSGGGY